MKNLVLAISFFTLAGTAGIAMAQTSQPVTAKAAVVTTQKAQPKMKLGCSSDDDCGDYRCVGQIMGPPCDFNNPSPGCNQYGEGQCSP